MNALRSEMTQYYARMRESALERDEAYQRGKNDLWQALDGYETANPDMPACLLKAKLHEEIAGRFEPVLFLGSPFFFEMGVRFGENWGTPHPLNAASWLIQKRNQRHFETEAWQNIRNFACGNAGTSWNVWHIWNVFDVDHHSLGYTKLLRVGVDGLINDIRQRREAGGDTEQLAFLEAAERSCRALLRCAARFSEKARFMLRTEKDSRARRNLQMIASAADRVPAKPPRNFHEGLAALLFLREATASLESVGISVLGHPDRLLGGLLDRDLAEGVLTMSEAGEMIGRWMLHTDIKHHVEDNPWPETSTCVELGGCDEDGVPVFNEVTRLFIGAHRAYSLINPKLNCRYGSKFPDAYVRLLAGHAAGGHNAFAFLNDDVLIPACVRAGKTEREARLYVNGGCQETIVEGVEHSAGAYYYFNMARILDLYLQPGETARVGVAGNVIPEPAAEAAGFDAFYTAFVSALANAIGQGAAWLRIGGQGWSGTHPCPLLSAGLEGCVASARDYTDGGAKYNPAALALVGFGTVVDSLYAIRQAVYEQRFVTLAELCMALSKDWKGHEPLRARMVALPKYGHGDAGCDALARRFAADITAFSEPLKNERGGPFQPSFFVYYFFFSMGRDTRATPDGRRNCEMLSQGVSPGRVRPAQNITDIMWAVGGVDLRNFPGNAVLDVQLPLSPGGGDGFADRLAAVMRTFAEIGGATLQTNAVKIETLKDAKAHPEQHQDIVVRISGLSAKFVCLDGGVQDEIISRSMSAC